MAYRAEVDEAEREAAEAAQKAADEAAAQAAADQAEAARRAEAEAEAADRRRRWQEMTQRLDGELEKQHRYVKDYGVTQPGGYRSQS